MRINIKGFYKKDIRLEFWLKKIYLWDCYIFSGWDFLDKEEVWMKKIINKEGECNFEWYMLLSIGWVGGIFWVCFF